MLIKILYKKYILLILIINIKTKNIINLLKYYEFF